MQTYLPPEVWRHLDPHAGQLSPRARARGWIALAVAFVLAVAGTVLWSAGLVVPKLAWALHAWEETSYGVRIQAVIRNAGRFPVTVVDVGRSGPGMDLVRVGGSFEARDLDPPFPVTLQPRDTVEATLIYRVTDCAAVPRRSWPVTVQVDRPWGTMSVDVSGEPLIDRWQVHVVVDSWCRPGR